MLEGRLRCYRAFRGGEGGGSEAKCHFSAYRLSRPLSAKKRGEKRNLTCWGPAYNRVPYKDRRESGREEKAALSAARRGGKKEAPKAQQKEALE